MRLTQKLIFACKVTHALLQHHIGHKSRLIMDLIGGFKAFYCTSEGSLWDLARNDFTLSGSGSCTSILGLYSNLFKLCD